MDLLQHFTNAIVTYKKRTGCLLNPFYTVGKHKYKLFTKDTLFKRIRLPVAEAKNIEKCR